MGLLRLHSSRFTNSFNWAIRLGKTKYRSSSQKKQGSVYEAIAETTLDN